jgi:hypothetical protein
VRYFSSSSFEDNLLRYEKDIKLAGIVYLRRITDSRWNGTPLRNIRMFGELCGDQAMKEVVLVTTMWDRGISQEVSNKREEVLFNTNCWKTMIDHGASTARFLNSADSAWDIIDLILNQHDFEALLLQEELVDLKRRLIETQAGKMLHFDLHRLLMEQRGTVRSLIEESRDEGDPQLAQALEAELEGVQKEFDKTFSEIKLLKISFGRKILMLFSKKPRGVRILIGIILFSFRTHYLFEQRSLVSGT